MHTQVIFAVLFLNANSYSVFSYNISLYSLVFVAIVCSTDIDDIESRLMVLHAFLAVMMFFPSQI
jgi:hypothetical protein